MINVLVLTPLTMMSVAVIAIGVGFVSPAQIAEHHNSTPQVEFVAQRRDAMCVKRTASAASRAETIRKSVRWKPDDVP